jgi:signal transduction histidine kinase
MFVSVFFSIAFYNQAGHEIQRITRQQALRAQRLTQDTDTPIELFFRPGTLEDLQEARQRLAYTLLAINGGILIFAGAAAYLLAGITLNPIKKMVDEQNRFISDSSHELRTPLTALRSEIEVALRNKKLTIEEAKKLLESNLEETINLQRLAESLLELAQGGSGIHPKNMSEISIKLAIEAAVKKIEAQARKKHITVNVTAKDLKIRGFHDRLIELFVILLDNAVKYSPSKNSVDITSKKWNRQLEFAVTDHGIGIDEKDIPFIFDRFYRAEKSRNKRETPGYGLGLSIAKKIAEVHGASIEVKSVPGKKTTFSVYFPV